MAYQEARRNFLPGGNNRILLATDGDFNVGPTSEAEMENLVATERKSGVFLTVLGFGSGNYQDARMELLADKGNGNYAYIDKLEEGIKVLGREMSGTLLTIAKDFKIQVEWNPAQVKSWRLVGYENRALATRDFADDTKDAGELGAGHTVTALYEIVPAGAAVRGTAARAEVPRSLRYQQVTLSEGAARAELGQVRLRWKRPADSTSQLLENPIPLGGRSIGANSENFRFAAAVAWWGQLLRNSEHVNAAGAGAQLSLRADGDGVIARLRKLLASGGGDRWAGVLSLARSAMGEDGQGERAELLRLVATSRDLAVKLAAEQRRTVPRPQLTQR